MRILMLLALVVGLIGSSFAASKPTDQECKMDPRREGCQK